MSRVGLSFDGDALLQQEFDHGIAAVLTCEKKRLVHLELCCSQLQAAVVVEESVDYIEAPNTAGGGEIKGSSAVGEEFCGRTATVGQAGIDDGGIDDCAVGEEELH